MGAAQAKNTAKEIASITNDISQQTDTISTNFINNYMSVNFNQCQIDAQDVNIKNYVQNNIKAAQITKALQNAKVVNDISQKLAQKAKADMGFLGVGYASATNSASTEANSTTAIVNAMSTVMQNLESSIFNFTCSGSEFKLKGDLNISNETFNDIASSQTVENTQIVDLSNSITQDISQTASATVQGATAFLILIIIIIGVVCVVFFGGASKSLPIVLTFGTVIGIIILFVWMYAVKAPPFFAPPVYVFPYAISPSENGAYGDKQPVNIQTREIAMKTPPLRYMYPLFNDITTDPKISLLSLNISQQVGSGNIQSNHGYNNANAKVINETWKKTMSEIYDQFDPSTGQKLKDINLLQYYNTKIPNDPNTIDYTTNSGGPVIWDQINGCEKVDCQGNKTFLVGTAGNDNCSGDNYCNDQHLALPNIDDFRKYASNPANSKFLRFVLADMFGFSTNVYIDDDEYVRYRDEKNNIKIGQAKDVDKRFIIRVLGNRGDPNANMVGSVTASTEFGEYPGAVYNTQKNMKTWGVYILVLVLIGVFVFIWVYARTKAKNKSKK